MMAVCFLEPALGRRTAWVSTRRKYPAGGLKENQTNQIAQRKRAQLEKVRFTDDDEIKL
jgi:hypothetical protein